MQDFKKSKKLLYFPGWLDKGQFHGYENSINLWEDPGFQIPAETEYIVAYSAGALLALQNWQRDRKEYVLILVNPLLPKRKLSTWLRCWIQFIMEEGTSLHWGRIKMLLHIVSATRKLINILSVDVVPMMDIFPKGQLLVIRGKQDYFFCDEESVRIIKEKQIPFVELPNVGHNWHSLIDETLERYCSQKGS